MMMKRRTRLIVTALVLAEMVYLCTELSAQSAPSSAMKTETDDAAEVSVDRTKPKRSRAISNSLAASLADSMPKYNPPPKPKAEEQEDEDVDLRDIDKPRNRIIRLPKYVVQEPKPPVFRERDLHSLANRTSLAMQRYAGLNFGPFSRLNRPIALAMYEEQERLNNMADLEDTARTVGVADKAAADYIRRESASTFMRTSEFGFQGGPK